MRDRRVRLLQHRTVRFLVVVALLAGGWEMYLRATAPGRIDAALAAELRREHMVNVAITLGFAPEDFHIRLFQTYGVVSGVRETTVLVSRVRSEDVERLARHYWVRQIRAQ